MVESTTKPIDWFDAKYLAIMNQDKFEAHGFTKEGEREMADLDETPKDAERMR